MAEFGIRHDVLRASRSTLIFGVLRSCIPALPRKLSLLQLPYTDQDPPSIFQPRGMRLILLHLSEISFNGLFPCSTKDSLTAFVGLQFRLNEIETLINT